MEKEKEQDMEKKIWKRNKYRFTTYSFTISQSSV